MEEEWDNRNRDKRFFKSHTLAESVPQHDQGDAVLFVILESMILPLSHNGFIYTLIKARLPLCEHEVLLSGSGDGTIKVGLMEKNEF